MSKMNYNRKVRKTHRKHKLNDWVMSQTKNNTCQACGKTPAFKFNATGWFSGKTYCVGCLNKMPSVF